MPLAEAMTLEIVYEDKDLLVVNKPSGLVVHPSKDHETGTLVNGLLAHVQAKGERLAHEGKVFVRALCIGLIRIRLAFS